MFATRLSQTFSLIVLLSFFVLPTTVRAEVVPPDFVLKTAAAQYVDSSCISMIEGDWSACMDKEATRSWAGVRNCAIKSINNKPASIECIKEKNPDFYKKYSGMLSGGKIESSGCRCTVTSNAEAGSAESSQEKEMVPEFATEEACADQSTPEKTFTQCTWTAELFSDTSADNALKSIFTTSDGNLGASLKGLNQLPGVSPQQLIGRVIKTAMGVIGTIALLILVYAGILWMVATGNAQRENEAKEIMYWGALGVIIILGSYAIVQFIIENAFTP